MLDGTSPIPVLCCRKILDRVQTPTITVISGILQAAAKTLTSFKTAQLVSELDDVE